MSRSDGYAFLREGSQCVILVFKTEVQSYKAKQVSSLFDMTLKDYSRCVKGSKITNRIVLTTSRRLKGSKALQIETHMIPYIISLQSDIVLYKSVFKDYSSFSSSTQIYRPSNDKMFNPLVQEGSSCDVPFQPNSQSHFVKMYFVSNHNSTNHDTLTTAGHQSSVNIHLNSKKPAMYLWHSWMTIFMHLFSCQTIFSPATLLPIEALWPALVHLCANAWRKSQLDRNKFANKTNMFVFSHRTLLLEEFVSLESKIGYGISSAHVKVNLPENNQNGTLKLQFNEKVPNLQFVLPVFYVEIVIPTFDYFLCSLRLTVIQNYKYQCFFHVLISKPLLPHKETIHVMQKGLNRNKTFVKPHLVLKNLCENFTTECFYQFISWIEAREECTSRGLYLPSIHSTKDMQTLKEQIEMYQCSISQYYQRKPHNGLHFSFMYEVIGIYAGLIWEVKMLLLLFCICWTELPHECRRFDTFGLTDVLFFGRHKRMFSPMEIL